MTTRPRGNNVLKKKLEDKNDSKELKIESVQIQKPLLETDKFGKEKKIITRHSIQTATDNIPTGLKKPVFLDCKKEFPTNTSKVK